MLTSRRCVRVGGAAAAAKVSAEQQLLAHLTRQYNPQSRPVYDASKPVLVNFTLKFTQIMDLVRQ